MSHLVSGLIGRLILAAIGLGWAVYNVHKLKAWQAVGRQRAPVRYPAMMAYRIGCTLFGAGWAIYAMTANFT